MFEKFKSIIESFLKANFLIRFAILTFISALGGSSYIGFISEFASYYYAWDVGFRIPAEGIQYLKLTVSAFSFLAISIGIVAFSLIYLVGQFALWYLSNMNYFGIGLVGSGVTVDFSEFTKLFQKKPFIKILPISIFISTLAGIAGFFIPYFDESIKIPSQLLASLTALVAFVFVLIIWNKKILIFSAVALSLLLSVSVPNMLFDSGTYAKLLQQLQYGGGIEIKVSTSYENTPVNFELLLRTTSSIIVKSSYGDVIEIPNSKINKINYGSSPKT